jgi:uncharacterized protein (TIGR03663 family)
MHTDEAVNAYMVGQLLAGEPFRYDPQDRHGPALDGLALPLARMQGAKTFADLTESELRLAPVLAGTVTILLFGAAAEWFGFVPCLIAALLFAGGSLPVYYDRYFIHESLFCAATFGFILAAWRAAGSGSYRAFVLTGACAAIMLACKETAILHFIAVCVAGLAFRWWNVREKRSRWLRLKPLLAAAFTFLLIILLLFTWFGTNLKALGAFGETVPDVLARAGGEGHQKPFWYFLQLLGGGWSGGLVLVLSGVGVIATIKNREQSAYGFLAYYLLLIAAMYSAIPYKTPWLALNLWLPMALFAARTVEFLWRMALKYVKLGVAVPLFSMVAGVAAVLIAHDTRQRVFLHPADEANPYAYAHTAEDLLGVAPDIEDLSRRHGIAAPRIAVIAADPWPLPWYLRHFAHVGFWQPGQQPDDADFYITSTEVAEQYADRLRGFRAEFFGARPNVLILVWSPAPK